MRLLIEHFLLIVSGSIYEAQLIKLACQRLYMFTEIPTIITQGKEWINF